MPLAGTKPVGKSGYVDRDGLRLHHLEYGAAGAPVVIVPGITSPAATWEFVSLDLARDYHVIALDVRGRGLSDTPTAGYALADYAGDVKAVIERLGLQRPALVGHSMGARIAAAVRVLHQGLAGPVVLADPPLTGPGRGTYPMSLEAFMDQLQAAGSGAAPEELLKYFPTLTPEHLALRAQWLPTCDENAVRESWLNFHREDFFGYLRELEPPALFMYGADSPVVPQSALQEVTDTRPDAEVARIPGAGHMIPWDNAARFLAETRRFLQRVSASPPA
ncbi:MAG: alpha/beta hydrolase [Solirubrobacterales bacterium]|nr:alpha/beta hydrolase [Solirubrobacterales bacterium]MBV8942898.1 alpha/beta hydrolase [Solirubrobacterales bacterium]MBV9164605.1 alpha/beta hydrolase [Solirubrobacterales bacterium]MBV9537140.1 alpha/beta hydrolase [Solirubrobacterales bacterium]